MSATVKDLDDIVLIARDSHENCHLHGDYTVYEVAPSPSLVMLHPAAEVRAKLRSPPEEISVIAATDEDGDPVHYHVEFSEQTSVPSNEDEVLIWAITETDYPHPADVLVDEH
jgi:hypothetical protein